MKSKPASRALAAAAVMTAAAAVAIPALASAQSHGGHGGPHGGFHGGPGWHGDIGHFGAHDWGVWRGGGWQHAYHGGRWGWWWVVGPTWYFYPSPVYPYPDPYAPPPVELVSPQPSAPAPQPRSWYYCDGSRGYYPYVPTCPGGWREVPAQPAQ